MGTKPSPEPDTQQGHPLIFTTGQPAPPWPASSRPCWVFLSHALYLSAQVLNALQRFLWFTCHFLTLSFPPLNELTQSSALGLCPSSPSNHISSAFPRAHPSATFLLAPSRPQAPWGQGFVSYLYPACLATNGCLMFCRFLVPSPCLLHLSPWVSKACPCCLLGHKPSPGSGLGRLQSRLGPPSLQPLSSGRSWAGWVMKLQ